jgi:hypothetical protein
MPRKPGPPRRNQFFLPMPDKSELEAWLRDFFDRAKLWLGEKDARLLFAKVLERPNNRPPGSRSTTPEQDHELLGEILRHHPGSMQSLARRLLQEHPGRYGQPSEDTFATRLRRLKKEHELQIETLMRPDI